MSLNLQGSEYLSAREAAELFGYSPDYVSRLCRNGLVVSQRIGKAWFVERESLKAFSLRSELEAEARRNELRAERINEIKDSITVHAVSSGTNPTTQYGLQAARVAAFVLGVSVFVFFTATSGVLPKLQDTALQIFSKTSHVIPESAVATALVGESPYSAEQKNSTANFSQGIPWYEKAWRFITSLFVRDEVVVVQAPVKAPPVVVERPVATTTVVVREPVRVVQQPAPAPTTIIENITRSVILSGVSQTDLANALTNLENKLRVTLSGITQVVGTPTPYYPPPSSGGIGNTIALLNNIDKLANVEITGGSITGATISGGNVTATSFSGTLGIASGGTGTTTTPTYGQVLLGNSSGGYDLVATSSLGISGGGSLTASSTLADFYDSVAVGRTSTTTIRGEPNATSTFAGGVFAVGLQVNGFSSTTALRVSSGFFQDGLTSCSSEADTVLYNSTTGKFFCGTDGGGGAGAELNWTFFNNSGIRISTTTNTVLIGSTSTSTLAKLEVVGDADISTNLNVQQRITALNASTTNFSTTYASSTNAFFGALNLTNRSLGGLALDALGNVYNAATSTLSTISGTLNLATQVTGDLLFSNLTQGGANTILANPTGATADFQAIATSTLGINFANLVGSASDAQVPDNITIDGSSIANATINSSSIGATSPSTGVFTLATTTSATTTNLRVSGALSFGGVNATTWSAFCTAITGGAGLCDGTDDAGAGTSPYEIATTSGLSISGLAYYTQTTGRTTLGSVSTTTLTTSGPLSLSNPVVVLGTTPSALSLATSTNNLFTGTPGQVLAYGTQNGVTGWFGFATTTAGTGLTYTGTAFNVNATQNITNLSNLSSDGVVYTTGGNGTLNVDTSGLDVARGGTGATSFTSSQLLYGNGTGAVQSVATSSLAVSSAFSYSGTLGALVGGANGTLSLATNGVALTNLAQVAANTILGNNTGALGNVVAFATSTLGINFADLVGSATDAQVANNLTINGGTITASTIDSTPIGATTPSTAVFTNSTSTNATTTNLAVSAQTRFSALSLGGLAVDALGRVYAAATSTLATISGALDLANQVTGILGVGSGGTGWATGFTANALLLGNGTNRLATTTAGTNGQVLALVSGVPTWVATTTLADITGTLAVNKGGTNATTQTTNGVNYFNGTAITSGTGLTFTGTNLGIGSTTPSFPLSVQGFGSHGGFQYTMALSAQNTSGPGILFTGGSTYDGREWQLVSTGSGNTAIGGAGNFAIIDRTANATRFLVASSTGNVAIGTTTPYSRLTVWGGATNTNLLEVVNSASTTALRVSASGFGTTTLSGLTVSGSATSTSNVGIDLSGGCFAINGTCVGGGSGSGTVNAGTAGQLPYYEANGTTLTATSTLLLSTAGRLGVGTTSPALALDVWASGTTQSGSYAAQIMRANGSGGIAFGANNGVAMIKGAPTVTSGSQGLAFSVTASGAESEAARFTNTGLFGIGTTTPQWLLNPTSASASQLALSAGAGVSQWAFRNAGGNLYIATTTVAGTATTSISALTINGTTGNVGLGTDFPTSRLSVLDRGGTGERTIAGFGANNTLDLFTVSYNTNTGTTTLRGSQFGDFELTAQANNDILLNPYGTGRVGIGTTSPLAKLQVGLGGGNLIDAAELFQFANNGTVTYGSIRSTANTLYLGTQDSGSGTFIGSFTNTNFALRTSFTDRLTVTNTGNIGIATSTPAFKMQIASDYVNVGDIGSGQFAVTGATDPTKRIALGYDTTNNYGFLKAGRVGMGWDNISIAPFGGNVGIGTTTPTNLLTIAGTSNGIQFYDTALGRRSLFGMFDGANTIVDSVGGGWTILKAGGVAGLSTTAAGGVSIGSYAGVTAAPANAMIVSGNVGVGTTTPWGLLSVNPNALGTNVPAFVIGSSTATNFIVTNAGNVGIGQLAPTHRLNVRSAASATNVFVVSGATSNGTLARVYDDSGVGILSVYATAENETIRLYGNGSSYLNGGNVGIGTTTPGGVPASGFTSPRVLQVTGQYAGLYLRRSDGATGVDITNDTQVTGATFIDDRYQATGGGFYFRTQTAGTPVNALRIDIAGNVGIGTTTPGFLLSTSGGKVAFKSTASTTAAFAVENNYGRNVFQVDTFDTAGSIFSVSTSTGGTYFTVAAAGNVGVGTTSPWRVFSVAGTGAWSGLTAAASGNVTLCINTTTKLIYEGSSATSCTPSSARFKNTIEDSTAGLSELSQLRPVTFFFNDQGDPTQQLGFIAEEVFAVDPRLVNLDAEGNPYSLKLDNFVSLAVSSIQELHLNINAIASSSSSTTSASENFATSFFNNLFAKITTWLADSANGIGKLFANEIHTKQICVAKSDGTEFCADGDTLAALAASAGGSPTPPPPAPPVPEPEPEPTPEPEPSPEPVPEETPAPTP